MTITGDGDPHLQYHSLSLLDIPDVNLEDFLHCFDDPISLDLLDEDGCAAIQSTNNTSHSNSRIESSLDVTGSPLRQPSELPRSSVNNKTGQPSDKHSISRVWPLSTSSDSAPPLVDSQGRRISIKLEASMNGLFFEAEKSRLSPHVTVGALSSAELTCYRRNIFKVNATVSLPQDVGHLAMSEGPSTERIVGVHAQLQATESMNKEKAYLIKTSSKNAPSTDTRASPPLSMSISLDQPRSTQPCPPINISWERIQFQKSTIKSPRPTGPMQTYQICVEVVGTLSNSRTVPLVRSESRPIIVRGRSPKSYLPDQKAQDSQPRPAALSRDLTSPGPSIIPPGTAATHNALRSPEAGGEFGIDEETRPVSNGSLLPENDNHCQRLPENYTYIPIPVMDWSPPVEAFFVSRLLFYYTTFLDALEINLFLAAS
ncbi:p53-like transcription factor [Aspergillus sclerotiicarbonarius CBS 121057]|uniref:p53-like transcription factor n=1 Tax=Aspergillus sclerotiicarbonarius (strain CBS 121057 / IBT 28362) TaxID=1448318 RepID=A0A319F7X1_ASPSB|nr:p53-like transcription factor [Aspergillus sclerotiicarbonarius CBS 121057]